MAMETREVEEIVCDGCGAREELIADEIPEGWFTGEVILHTYSGGEGGDWAACKSAHIKKAILTVTGAE